MEQQHLAAAAVADLRSPVQGARAQLRVGFQQVRLPGQRLRNYAVSWLILAKGEAGAGVCRLQLLPIRLT